MANEHQNHNESIVVVKKNLKKPGHHGGNWKLAYADFVTAMVAFFLLLWLLSLMDQNKLQGISNYFKKPMRDLFIENQMHDTNIPKVAADATMKSEMAPLKMDLDKRSLEQHKADSEKLASSSIPSISTKKLKAANTPDISRKNQPKPQPSESIKQSDMENLKKQLTISFSNNQATNQHKNHLNFQVVADGLKIEIKSLENKPMFSLGDIDFNVYAKNIINWLAQELNKTNKKIMIIGHTDAQPYLNAAGHGNWELSANRANAVRSYLIKHGLNSNKIVRVQGAGDAKLLDNTNGHNPSNRRIEIIVLSDKGLKNLYDN